MSGPPVLAEVLTALTGPWATGIATLLRFLTGGLMIPGHPDHAGAWILHTIAAFCVLILGANFLHALGWLP